MEWDDVRIRSEEARFWKTLGIRLLRLFGVACAFIGYVILVESILFMGFRDARPLRFGFGLLALGIPHILAANRLQHNRESIDPEYAFRMRPSMGRLLATGLILPGLSLAFCLVIGSGGDPAGRRGIIVIVATTLVYLSGVAVVYGRRAADYGGETRLTDGDRAYVRWGWVVLIGLAIPIATWQSMR